MRKVLKIKANNYELICTMDNGEKYSYDMSFIRNSNQEMVLPLKDNEYFKRVFIEFGSLAWPNGYDIHAETIIKDGRKINEEAA